MYQIVTRSQGILQIGPELQKKKKKAIIDFERNKNFRDIEETTIQQSTRILCFV